MSRFTHLPRRSTTAKISLRWVLVVPFVVQTVGAVALVGYLSYRSGQQATLTLAERLLQQTSERVSDRLDSYLQVHQRSVSIHNLAVEQGTLILNDREHLRQHLWQQMQFKSSLSSNGYWGEDGSATAYIRIVTEAARTQASQVSGQPISLGAILLCEARPNQWQFFSVDAQGAPDQLIYQTQDDFRTVPWYRYARALKRQAWTPIVPAHILPLLQTVAILPVNDATGELQGFFATHYFLQDISLFLNQLNFSPTGQVFIIDRFGGLVATSVQAEAGGVRWVNGTPERLPATESQDSVTRTIAQQIVQDVGDFRRLTQTQQLQVTTQGQQNFVQVTPYQDEYGLDWLVVTVIPEADFIGEIQRNTHTTVVLCLLTLGGAIASGLMITHRLTARMTRLNRMSQELADGKLSQRLPADSVVTEMQGVAQSFNQMADQLQQSFHRLQHALEDSEEKFTTVFRTCPDPIAITTLAEGRFLEANARMLDFYGYSREDLIGRTALELDLWANPEERQAFRQLLISQGYVHGLDIVTRLKSGQLRTVSLSAEICDLQGQQAIIFSIRDITDRKQAELALSQSELKFATIFRDIPQPAWIATVAEGRCLDINTSFCKVLGYSREESIGQTCMELRLWHDLADLHHFRRSLQETGKIRDIEVVFRTKAGELKTVLLSATVSYLDHQDCVIGTLKDISDRKQTETALRQALQELNHHVEHSPLATIRWDRDFRVQGWSAQAEKLFGWAVDEVMGKTMYDWKFIFDDDLVMVRQCAEKLLQGNSLLCQNRNYRKDGSVAYCEWYNSILLDEQGQVISILSLVQDVSDRKLAELELQQAKEAAEAANHAKSAFLANMSHELRTPLNVILGFTQLMKRDSALPLEAKEQIDIISNNGNNLLQLINDILDLSKIEAGKLTVESHPTHLFELLHTLQNMFWQQAINRGLQLRLDIQPGVPEFILVDAQKLQQVLINLLGNALKFTQQGQVTLRVQRDEEESNSQNWSFPRPSRLPPSVPLRFIVEDTGVGVSTQDFEIIFEAFGQASVGRQLQEGTGLGLAISRKLVQLMGGEITVISQLGQGSVFQFTIPVQSPPGTPPPAGTSGRQVVGLAPGQPQYRILVVDDRADNRLVLMKLFRQLHLDVRETSSGEEAIAQWQDWHPHLIWMDLRMPGLDGCETTRRIRELERNAGPNNAVTVATSPPSRTIIIALTAQASATDRTMAIASGCDDYISKPFEIDDLLGKMADYLGLSYIYASSGRGDDDWSDRPALHPPLTAADVSVMPQDWIVQLHHSAQGGDEQAVLALLNQIPPHHVALAVRLRQLVQQFNFHIIVAITTSLAQSFSV